MTETSLDRLKRVAETNRALYEVFKIIVGHIQFKEFGHWEADPDEPGEKLFTTSGADIDLLTESCLASAYHVRNAIVDQCADRLAALAEEIGQAAEISQPSDWREMLFAKGQTYAEAAVTLRALKTKPSDIGARE
jgi:hypothetical protein